MGILGFILYLIVAAACAWLADYIVPGRIPGGFFTAAIIGVIGAWLGVSLMGGVGPALGGVPLVPAIIGSGLLVFLLSLVSHRWSLR